MNWFSIVLISYWSFSCPTEGSANIHQNRIFTISPHSCTRDSQISFSLSLLIHQHLLLSFFSSNKLHPFFQYFQVILWLFCQMCVPSLFFLLLFLSVRHWFKSTEKGIRTVTVLYYNPFFSIFLQYSYHVSLSTFKTFHLFFLIFLMLLIAIRMSFTLILSSDFATPFTPTFASKSLNCFTLPPVCQQFIYNYYCDSIEIIYFWNCKHG